MPLALGKIGRLFGRKHQVGCIGEGDRAAVPGLDHAGLDAFGGKAGRSVDMGKSTIDDQAVGSGTPGPRWQAMYARLQQHLDAIASRPALEPA